MKKTSCCCGATKDKPCACMKKGVMECSSKEPKCPCYKAKDLKKSFDAGWSVVKGETCNHMRVGKEPCIACGGNRESNTKDPAKEVIKGWEEDWDKAMWEMDNTPSDMCKLCKKDMNDPANLAPYQHEAMLETGAFPDYCIHCQKEHGLPGDF